MNNKVAELSSEDIYLFHEGTHYNSYNFLGAHITKENRRIGFRFTVWAPKAKEVRVVGNFNNWNGQDHKMIKVSNEGLWSLFIQGFKEREVYKYEILGEHNKTILKSDPYAFFSEVRPNTASITINTSNYNWKDILWMNKRKYIDIDESPMNIYEMHLGSWKRNEKGEFLTYRELAKELPKYIKSMKYTHIEIMPLMEYPLDKSWGYQATGYYSPTSRYGTPKDLKYLIDCCHRQNIGVIMDWVPGHFCRDSHGLYMFDTTPQFEYEDETKANHPGWGVSNFDLGKPEVRSFLISNAIYYIKEFHIDGLRIDAVSNMLYLDFGRENWKPNIYGGNENVEAIEFLKLLKMEIERVSPEVLTIAEESTTFKGVTQSVSNDGLGFNYKWNMGWMNDVLKYMECDVLYRKYHHNLMTFSMMYAYSERFILPISHDEVVHGKKSLVDKMWGDYWTKFAGFRGFMTFMYTHPGKKLLFMGNEFAQFLEWRYYESLEWHLLELESHKKAQFFTKKLNELYLNERALWKFDNSYEGFQWIDANNNEQSIFIFKRKTKKEKETLIIVCNFTSVVYYDFKVGVPHKGTYKEIFNSDDEKYGGSGQVMEGLLHSVEENYHGEEFTIRIKVPPMATTILKINSIERIQGILKTDLRLKSKEILIGS